MVALALLVTNWLICAALGSTKFIPQAQNCHTYTNANTNHATCGNFICPYGCSWPFVTAENCVPAAAAACITKLGTYKCTGGISGFAACTGCRFKST
ncbi:hypothetical protein VP01_1762g2 [Puccinia sorghi]|uniref:Uncharacterized protein n=1 Tax=Puccinia sorghi TaxID=27349 RepID=A0A0L6VEX8_9BASI|nr:hypothetical protein VP01_1762g2 [Puccinia sorghi]